MAANTAEAPAASAVAATGTLSQWDTIAAHDDLPVTDLVARSKDGDPQAWNALVRRYARLVWSICRQYRLEGADADDVAQNVWLRLVDHLASIRNPAALAGWLATTTTRECARATRRSHAAERLSEADNIADATATTAEQELLMAERRAALREAAADVPQDCQRLLALLLRDPPVTYDEISAELGIPVGSIGPTRGRCLQKLRRHPAIAALINAESEMASTHADGGSTALCAAGSLTSERRPREVPER